MDQQQADYIISQYIKPLYGFAVNKLGNLQQAEELASRIVLEVYRVLRSKSDIVDVNSYIFKVAHNVWAKYCGELSGGRKTVSSDGLDMASASRVEDGLLRDDERGVLRREIAYLSAQRRKIVMAYYFENKKIEQIARQMNVPAGTVKWHLFESKKELKEGMEIGRTIGELGLNPIRFSDMGHHGLPGTRGDTSNFMQKSLAQNVAYACYFTPRDVNEVAQELGVSPIFVEDEMNELAEYGFLDKLPRGKYRTNMIIKGHTGQTEPYVDLYSTYAAQIVDCYYAKLLDIRAEMEKLPIYYTDRDYNFLLWSLIMYASSKLYIDELTVVDFNEVAVHRKDGGHYIAAAYIGNGLNHIPPEDEKWKMAIGYMLRNDGKVNGLKLGVHWAGEDALDWRNTHTDDYKLLYYFINGALPQDERNLDSYETLVSKGYLYRDGGEYRANIVYIPDAATKQAFDALMPRPEDDAVLAIARKLDAEMYAQAIKGQPAHMHRVIRYTLQNTIAMTHVYAMKNMLDRGMLALPAAHQQKQICNILYITD